MKKFVIKFSKIALLVLAVFFKLTDYISSFNYEAFISFAEKTLGIESADAFIEDYNYQYVPESVAIFFDNYFFPIFLTISLVLAIVGTIFLTKRRSVITAIGLLLAFIIPKENIFWGSIKDKSTRSIIPFAVIRVVRLDDKGKREYIAQSVADVDGRYSLYLPNVASDYRLEVEAPGYKPSSESIEGIVNGQEAFNVVQDVILSREDKKSSKKAFNYNKPKLYKILMWLVYANSILFLLSFIYYVIAWPGEYYGWISLATFTYSVYRNTRVIKQRFFAPKGRFKDSKTKKEISGVTVNFFKDGQKLESVVSDEHGIVKSSSMEGKYHVSVERQGFKVRTPIPWKVEGSAYFVTVEIDKEGYLKNDILLESVGKEEVSSSNNPFS